MDYIEIIHIYICIYTYNDMIGGVYIYNTVYIYIILCIYIYYVVYDVYIYIYMMIEYYWDT
jgi:hypothetical protein